MLLCNHWFPAPAASRGVVTEVFLEKLEGAAVDWALTAEDFEKSWLPRPVTGDPMGFTAVGDHREVMDR